MIPRDEIGDDHATWGQSLIDLWRVPPQLNGCMMLKNLNYRSAEQIGTLASNALAQTGVGELRSLRVDAVDNKLKLSGAVRSYYHKQLAQEALRSVLQGVPVQNDVAVCG